MPCACVSFYTPSHITSNHTAPNHTTPDHNIRHRTTHHHTTSCGTTPHHTISWDTTPQYTSQYHIIPHHIILHHTTLFNTIPHHTMHMIVHFTHATVQCNIWLGWKHFSQFISIQLDSINPWYARLRLLVLTNVVYESWLIKVFYETVFLRGDITWAIIPSEKLTFVTVGLVVCGEFRRYLKYQLIAKISKKLQEILK